MGVFFTESSISNEVDNDKRTCLHAAACGGYVIIINSLMYSISLSVTLNVLI